VNTSSSTVKLTPSLLILKLSWDSERQASSNFVLRKRKKPTGETSGKYGHGGDHLDTINRQEALDNGSGVDWAVIPV
jgi:hypothetical protein